MSILKAIDADDKPAGKGRDPPQNLPFPRFIPFHFNFINLFLVLIYKNNKLFFNKNNHII